MHQYYNCEEFPRLLETFSDDEFIVYTHLKSDGYSDCVNSKIDAVAGLNSATLCVAGTYGETMRTVDYPRKGKLEFPADHIEFVGFRAKLLRNSGFRSLAAISPSHAFWALLAFDCVFTEVFTLKPEGVTEEYLEKLRMEYSYGYEELLRSGLRVHKFDGMPEES